MLSAPILAKLRTAVGADGLIVERNQLQTYECDGLASAAQPAGGGGSAALYGRGASGHTHLRPASNTLRGRGAGTGLSGGALPDDRGIVISFARMTRIPATDMPNQRVTVEPGVINAHVTQRVAPAGHFYAPDPSSQTVCTIGGNVAENAGGAHCLKYGFTTNHVLALEVVLPTGELVHLGSPTLDPPGYDLAGVFVGQRAHWVLPAP